MTVSPWANLRLVAVAVLALDEARGVRRHLGRVADGVDVVAHELREDGLADGGIAGGGGGDPDILVLRGVGGPLD